MRAAGGHAWLALATRAVRLDPPRCCSPQLPHYCRSKWRRGTVSPLRRLIAPPGWERAVQWASIVPPAESGAARYRAQVHPWPRPVDVIHGDSWHSSCGCR